MSCSTCFEIYLKSCVSTIDVVAGLSPATEYYWLITTPKGKLYQRQATTDSNGKLSIDASLLPAGLLNPHAGSFSLEVRQGSNYLAKVPLVIAGVSYDCVQMNFIDIAGDSGINNQIPSAA